MKTSYFEKGKARWNYNDILAELDNFIPIFVYKVRNCKILRSLNSMDFINTLC